MKGKLLLLTGLMALSLSVYAQQSNMLIPMLKCTIAAQEVEKGESKDKSFTILADFTGLITQKNGKAVLVISEEGSLAGSFGTVILDSVTDNGLGNGIVFRSDLVTYNNKFKWTNIVTVKVDNETNSISAVLRQEPGTEETPDISTKYNCNMLEDL